MQPSLPLRFLIFCKAKEWDTINMVRHGIHLPALPALRDRRGRYGAALGDAQSTAGKTAHLRLENSFFIHARSNPSRFTFFP